MPGKASLIFSGFADNFLFDKPLSEEEFHVLVEELADYPHMIPDKDWYDQRKYALHNKLWNKWVYQSLSHNIAHHNI